MVRQLKKQGYGEMITNFKEQVSGEAINGQLVLTYKEKSRYYFVRIGTNTTKYGEVASMSLVEKKKYASLESARRAFNKFKLFNQL